MKKKEQSKLSQRLIELRKELNLSQYKLAEKLGYSRGLISNYEQGTREPDLNTLKSFSFFFGVTVDYLLGLTNIRHPMNESVKKEEIKTEDLSEIEKISNELPEKEREQLKDFAKYLSTKSKLNDTDKESSATSDVIEEKRNRA